MREAGSPRSMLSGAHRLDDGTSGGAGRLLVVDDDDLVRVTFVRALERAGFAVESAHSAESALRRLDSTRFDAVLSDITMPGLDGIQFLAELRRRDLTTQVVLVTANPTVDTAIRAVELGAARYVTKPVTYEPLVAAMREAVSLTRFARVKQAAMELTLSQFPLAGDRVGLELAFERALATLEMHFQPIVSVRERRVWGYEALMRPQEPALPGPQPLLVAAESLNRLRELGRRTRGLAAAAAVDALPPGVLLLVNLHAADLLDPELGGEREPLTALAARVVLEVTERAAVQGGEGVEATVARLRGLGFGLALDDLGAGYAGLVMFLQLKPGVIKLDMEIVRNVHGDPRRQSVVRTVAALCRDMGALLVCEGVETAVERDALAALGCDLMQGYFFGYPRPGFLPPDPASFA